MTTPTYSAKDWRAAQEAWRDFGYEWRWVKDLATSRGFCYPPSGTKHDDRDAPEPSQRAIVYRALAEQPTELRRILSRSRSWHQVVDAILGMEARLREDAGYSEKSRQYEDRVTHGQSVMSIGAILERLRDSIGPA